MADKSLTLATTWAGVAFPPLPGFIKSLGIVMAPPVVVLVARWLL